MKKIIVILMVFMITFASAAIAFAAPSPSASGVGSEMTEIEDSEVSLEVFSNIESSGKSPKTGSNAWDSCITMILLVSATGMVWAGRSKE